MFPGNNHRTLFVALLSAALFQNCSKKADDTPAVVPDTEITDTGGLTITLTYDKTPATTDLDLYLYRKSNYTGTSNPQGATIGPNDGGIVSTDIMVVAPDEDLTVVAAYRTGTVAKSYTLTFRGIATKKTYTVNGSFAANLAPFATYNYFGTPRGNNITLKKSGTTFTVVL
ncbi:MAG: hypothetical protein H7319_05450 [Spirosoma sp.]|nr:hypothetical protein [Spirosoma sp.]